MCLSKKAPYIVDFLSSAIWWEELNKAAHFSCHKKPDVAKKEHEETFIPQKPH